MEYICLRILLEKEFEEIHLIKDLILFLKN